MKMLNLSITLTCILLYSACSNSSSDIYSNESSFCTSEYTLPINSFSDAICFASRINDVQANLQNAREKANYPGWQANALQEDDGNWIVTFNSYGKVMPAYQCEVRFTGTSHPTTSENSSITKNCRFRK